MAQPLLQAVKLSHAFDYPLYDDVSLEVCAGESVAVMGPSGSGKSTLLHSLAGLIPPRSGEVRLLGKALYDLSESERERLRRYETGIVFQHHYLFRGMSAWENIEIAALLAQKKADKALADRLGITKVLHQKVSELSGGQQQRVSLARVLAKEPRIIFADEPTGNLDRENARGVMEMLLEYVGSQKAGLFLVTHDEHIAKSCDQIYRLEAGKFCTESSEATEI